jgi:transcriptional regulator with XRE-family HTH domain
MLEELHRRRWSDAQLSRELGFAPSTIGRWRAGEREPTAAFLVRKALLELLQIP